MGLATPRAMLIDLDDTILMAGRRPAVLLQIAEEQAAALAPHTPAELAAHLEIALELFWSDPERHKVARFGIAEARRQVVRETLEGLQPALSREIADRFAERFTAIREELTQCFPGALEGLQALRRRGIKLALITNGSSATQRAKIKRFRLASYFHHIQIEGEAGFGKPEEQAYRHAMAALGVEPDETWIVGDHLEWEVAAPQRLGITAVWCDGFGRGLPPDTTITPDYIVTSLAEVDALFGSTEAEADPPVRCS
ncbi:HAD family hydrolase [Phenylobacterium sp.]|jgi:putative hydrolase of the HAD superfamily|uniref:HAD family hydrolase n=1 Tax=Phenylobacterium sp. TaxID=1871053 RepID=UPI002F3E977C